MPPFIHTPASKYNDIVFETAGKCSSYQPRNHILAKTLCTETDYKQAQFRPQWKQGRKQNEINFTLGLNGNINDAVSLAC